MANAAGRRAKLLHGSDRLSRPDALARSWNDERLPCPHKVCIGKLVGLHDGFHRRVEPLGDQEERVADYDDIRLRRTGQYGWGEGRNS